MRMTETNSDPSKLSPVELKTNVWSGGGRFEQWMNYYNLALVLTTKHLGLQCDIDFESLLPFSCTVITIFSVEM